MQLQGKFISFEGIDGCGKSTQLSLLLDFLEQKKIPWTKVREPGGCILGEGIRSLLLNPDQPPMSTASELLLFFAARAQLVEEVIRPALMSGKWVIADRFIDATYAYQGYGRSVHLETIDQLRNLACGDTLPDLTIYMDISLETMENRLRASGEKKDRMEQQGIKFFTAVRKGYQILAQNNPRIKQISGEESRESIHQTILNLINPYFAR